MRRRTIAKSKNMMEISDHITGNSYIGIPGKKIRSKRENVTPEAVRKNNIRLAEKRLRLLIDMNFKADDYYLTLTFKDKQSEKEAKEKIVKFFRKIRDAFNKEKHICKYIYIMEVQGRIHFHALLNRGIELSTQLLKKWWPHGYTKIEFYRGEAEDAIGLAKYFLKERKSEMANHMIHKKWVSSKTLEQPEVKTKTIKATEWRQEIKIPNGYYLDKDSVYEGINNYGFPFRTYRLIRLPEWRAKDEQAKSAKTLSVLRE